MASNSFGTLFRMTSFGESHGVAMGVVIDGIPAGIHFDEELLKRQLDRRKPGSSEIVTARTESDNYEILSGIFEGKTLGTPIAVVVRNTNQKSSDYDSVKQTHRAGHADDVWKNKFGHSDHRGGGRSSGRETVSRVIAGSFAEMFCRKIAPQAVIESRITQVGPYENKLTGQDLNSEISKALIKAKTEGESYGGILEIKIKNIPANLGQPVFHKLKADLAAALMSIGATSAVEFGAGVSASAAKGTEFHQTIDSENYGGIRGGISTGEPIVMRLHFKPTSSILDVAKKGRHDPCILVRALPVAEAMVWIVLADHLLWARMDKA